MGSSFDDLLGQYEAPTDYDIVLPGRVGAAGNKGGSNAAAAPAPVTSPGTPADSHPAGTAPEPAPQLPEGSDDNDAVTDEQSQVEQDPQKAAHRPEAEAAAADSDNDAEKVEEPDDAEFSTRPDSAPVQQAAAHPVIPRKGGGLSFEGPSVNLKYFPRVLIEQMREMLKPHLGEDFARDLSQFSLVTAFAIAALGTELTTDEYTAHAVKAFRANDPKADVIEKRTAALLEQQTRLEGSLKKIFDRLGDVAETATVLEMGQAYALAERTALLDTDGVLPETIDVTQKRAVASRDNIRARVKKHQAEEKIRSGRPIR